MPALLPLPLIIDALAFAAHKHRDQRRKDKGASPYINHPVTLAHILGDRGRRNRPDCYRRRAAA
jgi:(p)ppGpp synthase/HD superfamily hydrolase